MGRALGGIRQKWYSLLGLICRSSQARICIRSMKTYVINLARSPERLKTFTARALEHNIRFNRMAAVDAHDLHNAEFEAWHSKCRRWLPMTRGEVACFLSHRDVWRRVVASQEPWSFIAEDDIVLARDAGHFLTSSDWLPADVDVIKAETMFTAIEMSGKVLGRHQGHVVRALKSNHNGSAGYFVSRDGASRLLAFTDAHCEPADRILFHPSQAASHGIRIGQMEPAICMQDFHLRPDVQRDVVNTIGVVPRLAGRTKTAASRTPLARVSRKIGGAVRGIQKAGRMVFHVSVFRRVEMKSWLSGQSSLSHEPSI
jgi:glycosyl transferase, family 25